MSILVIFTGGTIGSTAQAGWISPDASANYALLQAYEQATGLHEDFSTTEPYTILSENLDAASLNKLLTCVRENVESGFDGIIVTHGTDTLQYSAAALALAFPDAPVPVILVSSDFPLDDPRANGTSNFTAAVAYIRQRQGRGIRVAYRNSGDALVTIHYPLNLLEHGDLTGDLTCDGAPERLYDCATDTFTAPSAVTSSQAGSVTAVGQAARENATSQDATVDSSISAATTTESQAGSADEPGLRYLHYADDPRVSVIVSRPGAQYSCDWEHTKTVLLVSYHSGTLDTANPRLAKFCAEAQRRGVPAYLVGEKDGDQYASTQIYGELGLLPAPERTLIACYMSAWAANSI